jgi:hypothetical protein
LKITKQITKLSPSAFIKSHTCPFQYYLEKLSEIGFPRDKGSLAASVGTWFDVRVKEALIAAGIESSLPIEMIRASLDIEDEEIRNKAIMMGDTLFDEYRKAGFLRDTKWKSLERHSSTAYRGIELTGQLDATVMVVVDSVLTECVLDFKVSGANSKTGVSPKPGYKKIYGTNIFYGEGPTSRSKTGWEGPHKNYNPNIAFHTIDLTWAIQFCWYAWLLDPESAGEKDFFVEVHSPIYTGKGLQVKFVVYQGWCTVAFQRALLKAIDNYIDRIESGVWVNPLKNPHVLKHNPQAVFDIISILANNESWMTKFVLPGIEDIPSVR